MSSARVVAVVREIVVAEPRHGCAVGPHQQTSGRAACRARTGSDHRALDPSMVTRRFRSDAGRCVQDTRLVSRAAMRDANIAVSEPSQR